MNGKKAKMIRQEMKKAKKDPKIFRRMYRRIKRAES